MSRSAPQLHRLCKTLHELVCEDEPCSLSVHRGPCRWTLRNDGRWWASEFKHRLSKRKFIKSKRWSPRYGTRDDITGVGSFIAHVTEEAVYAASLAAIGRICVLDIDLGLTDYEATLAPDNPWVELRHEECRRRCLAAVVVIRRDFGVEALVQTSPGGGYYVTWRTSKKMPAWRRRELALAIKRRASYELGEVDEQIGMRCVDVFPTSGGGGAIRLPCGEGQRVLRSDLTPYHPDDSVWLVAELRVAVLTLDQAVMSVESERELTKHLPRRQGEEYPCPRLIPPLEPLAPRLSPWHGALESALREARRSYSSTAHLSTKNDCNQTESLKSIDEDFDTHEDDVEDAGRMAPSVGVSSSSDLSDKGWRPSSGSFTEIGTLVWEYSVCRGLDDDRVMVEVEDVVLGEDCSDDDAREALREAVCASLISVRETTGTNRRRLLRPAHGHTRPTGTKRMVVAEVEALVAAVAESVGVDETGTFEVSGRVLDDICGDRRIKRGGPRSSVAARRRLEGVGAWTRVSGHVTGKRGALYRCVDVTNGQATAMAAGVMACLLASYRNPRPSRGTTIDLDSLWKSAVEAARRRESCRERADRIAHPRGPDPSRWIRGAIGPWSDGDDEKDGVGVRGSCALNSGTTSCNGDNPPYE